MLDLATYFTVPQTADVLNTTERRVRQWQAIGVLQPAARKGLLQFRRHDVIRAALLQHLQGFLGENSTAAVEFVRELSPDALDAILDAAGADGVPVLEAGAGRGGFRFRVELSPGVVAALRARLETVPW